MSLFTMKFRVSSSLWAVLSVDHPGFCGLLGVKQITTIVLQGTTKAWFSVRNYYDIFFF